jgi:fermentation-respiration switch protein FrsA (DUF1100 family)
LIHSLSIPFWSNGTRLAGRLFRNTDSLEQRQPGIIVTGSWLTVKEQMPAVYATRLAELGYAAFTFDFTGFGESAGDPRQAEIPDRKIADLIAAADFLSTLAMVDSDALAHVGVCASAQYGVAAMARGSRVKRFVSVAGWFHNPTSVAPFYGGAAGVADRLATASQAIRRYNTSGEVDLVPAYKVGDVTAAMSFELDYYANPSRGATPEWNNAMAALSWLYWLTYDGLSAASQVTAPALFVHSDGCVFPENLRAVYAKLQGPKRLEWLTGSQIDFYDQHYHVEQAVRLADAFLKEFL